MRSVVQTFSSHPARDGAGVKLRRIFGYHETALFDPFLMLDHFGSENPDDYIAGFPWHPHRGIETVTYMLAGKVEHGDSLGNSGTIEPGDLQWMTAGSGIIHQEMPKPFQGTRMEGFQLWVNLRREDKMTDPRYREVKVSTVPRTTVASSSVKILAGAVNGFSGPVTGISVDPLFLDVHTDADGVFRLESRPTDTVFAYVYEGEGVFGAGKTKIGAGTCMLFSQGDCVEVMSNRGCRFIFVSGHPIREPIAWRGPIVMNTEEELDIAFEEYESGSFIKTGRT